MRQSSKMGVLFLAASILSVLAFPYNPLIIFKVIEPNNIKLLLYVGWIFWALGLTLIVVSYYSIFFRKTKVLIAAGIYGIVRHPMYLGWILGIFIATILCYQHWVFVITGIPGIVSIYLISLQEEHRNIETFGDDYRCYMQKVPRMNLLMGIIGKARRREEDQNKR